MVRGDIISVSELREVNHHSPLKTLWLSQIFCLLLHPLLSAFSLPLTQIHSTIDTTLDLIETVTYDLSQLRAHSATASNPVRKYGQYPVQQTSSYINLTESPFIGASQHLWNTAFTIYVTTLRGSFVPHIVLLIHWLT